MEGISGLVNEEEEAVVALTDFGLVPVFLLLLREDERFEVLLDLRDRVLSGIAYWGLSRVRYWLEAITCYRVTGGTW